MPTRDKAGTVSVDDLILSTLASTDALSKLLIEKGLITQAGLMQKISAEGANCRAMLKKRRGN